jgi:hypothetical protein
MPSWSPPPTADKSLPLSSLPFVPFCCHPVRDLLLSLSLLLPVPLHHPQSNGCHIHRARCDGWDAKCALSHDAVVFALLLPTTKTRHFDRSSSRSHREQRSGEIRFSTQTTSQPLPRLCLLLVSFAVAVACFSLELTQGPVILSEGRREATESIAFASAVNFLLPFSAQKSHVMPQNHLTHFQSTTSAWHVSYPKPAILNI